MPRNCPHCDSKKISGSYFVRFGFFFRSSDSRYIQRYRCVSCRFTCSNATFNAWFRQKKRQKNHALRMRLAGAGSLRRAAKDLHLNRKTVARKLAALGFEAAFHLKKGNLEKPKARVIEFDDLETFEHTKCKPLSITLAVESKTRRILGIEVSTIAAKGLLVEKAKKYGRRPDGRSKARARLFRDLQEMVVEDVLIKSDSNPHYRKDVLKYFPKAKYRQYEGKRGSLGGQGELKKTKFDPLFSLNHTCAMFRANVNRLIRKTWCTTKRADRLYAHLMIYAHYHNQNLG